MFAVLPDGCLLAACCVATGRRGGSDPWRRPGDCPGLPAGEPGHRGGRRRRVLLRAARRRRLTAARWRRRGRRGDRGAAVGARRRAVHCLRERQRARRLRRPRAAAAARPAAAGDADAAGHHGAPAAAGRRGVRLSRRPAGEARVGREVRLQRTGVPAVGISVAARAVCTSAGPLLLAAAPISLPLPAFHTAATGRATPAVGCAVGCRCRPLSRKRMRFCSLATPRGGRPFPHTIPCRR